MALPLSAILVATISWGLAYTYLDTPLVPERNSAYPWDIKVSSDTEKGGLSQVHLSDSASSVAVSFRLKGEAEYPYAGIDLLFSNGEGKAQPVDLSDYTRIALNISCTPANILIFHIYSFDSHVSTLGDISSYRKASMYLDCSNEVQSKILDVNRFIVPAWWLHRHGMKLSDTGFQIEKVLGFQLTSSHQSPLDVISSVEITDLALQGRYWRHFELITLCLAVFGGAAVVWGFKAYKASSVRAQSAKIDVDEQRFHSEDNGPPFTNSDTEVDVAHAHQDTESVLRFFANEYANVEMSLEYTAIKLQINRNKINAILKNNVGLTSSEYIKKLRLDEAARLLESDEDYRIATIAQAVGYQNVSYFNRIFKTEYGCSPKSYRQKFRNNGVR